MTTQHTTFECGPEEQHWAYEPAPQEAVDMILNAPVNTNDGRSNWIWIRLPNGDACLAVFPQGDTYLGTEHLRSI